MLLLAHFCKKAYPQKRERFEHNTGDRDLMFSFRCFFVAQSLYGCGFGGQFPLDPSKLSLTVLRALSPELTAIQSSTHQGTISGRCAKSTSAIHVVSGLEVSDEEYVAARLGATRLGFFTNAIAESVDSSSWKVGPCSNCRDVGQPWTRNATPGLSLSGQRNVHAMETRMCLCKGGFSCP